MCSPQVLPVSMYKYTPWSACLREPRKKIGPRVYCRLQVGSVQWSNGNCSVSVEKFFPLSPRGPFVLMLRRDCVIALAPVWRAWNLGPLEPFGRRFAAIHDSLRLQSPSQPSGGTTLVACKVRTPCPSANGVYCINTVNWAVLTNSEGTPRVWSTPSADNTVPRT